MSTLFLGLGSNVNPKFNIAKGLDALNDVFGELQVSSVYKSAAVGISGPPFLNMLVGSHHRG
jgi:2-amino-4-hydroxy-6-hydroxymethyldihydropteridine diphosphokinase